MFVRIAQPHVYVRTILYTSTAARAWYWRPALTRALALSITLRAARCPGVRHAAERPPRALIAAPRSAAHPSSRWRATPDQDAMPALLPARLRRVRPCVAVDRAGSATRRGTRPLA